MFDGTPHVNDLPETLQSLALEITDVDTIERVSDRETDTRIIITLHDGTLLKVYDIDTDRPRHPGIDKDFLEAMNTKRKGE